MSATMTMPPQETNRRSEYRWMCERARHAKRRYAVLQGVFAAAVAQRGVAFAYTCHLAELLEVEIEKTMMVPVVEQFGQLAGGQKSPDEVVARLDRLLRFLRRKAQEPQSPRVGGSPECRRLAQLTAVVRDRVIEQLQGFLGELRAA